MGNQKNIKLIIPTILVVCICILLISSSDAFKDKPDKKNTKPLSEYLGERVDISLKGSVVNDNNEPLDSVTITVGNQTVQTDTQGQFEIKNAAAYENFLPVEAQRKGYQNMVINLNPKDKKNDIDITLKKEGTTCLFWFCKHNHNLPATIN
ncbi:MAG: carboxypeptidase-like regulatory domain-containing protein [Winogradskyella sp.]